MPPPPPHAKRERHCTRGLVIYLRKKSSIARETGLLAVILIFSEVRFSHNTLASNTFFTSEAGLCKMVQSNNIVECFKKKLGWQLKTKMSLGPELPEAPRPWFNGTSCSQ